MKNISFKKLLLSFGLLFSFAFVSCIDPNNAILIEEANAVSSGDFSIVGTWESSWGEKFVITPTEFKNYYGDSECYTGNNLYIKKLSSTSGYIYFKYTKAFCSTHSDVFDADAPDVGKWYTVYYYDLTAQSVKISGAVGAVSSFDTIQEAVNGFTVANGYFSSDSECVKTATGSGTITDVSTVLSAASTATGSTGGESGGSTTPLYYVRRSYTDPSDPNYANILSDDTYWDVLIIDSSKPNEFNEITYPEKNNKRVREEYTWSKNGEYFYLLDEDNEPVNGAKVTFTNNSITRKAAIGFDYLDYIELLEHYYVIHLIQ